MNQEIGHVFGFDDVSGCSTQTVVGAIMPGSFTKWGANDTAAVNNKYPIPTDPYCNPTECSPIVIDFGTRGLDLTGPEVWFDMAGLGQPVLFGWTAMNAEDGFLALDRNGNGTIDDGRELFGNFTPMSRGLSGPPAPNGFEALAWFDRPENGGNGDGLLTLADAVYGELRVWFDRNHNGVSEPEELVPLTDAGVISIALDTHETRQRDRFGNLLKFRARVEVQRGDRIVHTLAYDVLFTSID